MGCFAILYAPCPRCRKLNTEQTKAGNCFQEHIYFDSDNERDLALFNCEIFTCEDCGIRYEKSKVSFCGNQGRKGRR